VKAPTTLVAAEGDTIVPRGQLESLAGRLDGPAHLLDIATLFGHDAFLTEPDKLGAILRTALSSPTLP
jgi:homoserine O-acetyltransferase